MIKRVGVRAADTVTKLSVLSPEQLRDMQEKREEYLTQMPSMDDMAAEVLTRRLLAASSIEIYNEYLDHISEMYVPVKKDAEYDKAFMPAYNIRYFNITKWVSNKKENSIEKLVNVYEVLANEECNIALIFHRTCEATEVYMAVTNTLNADNNIDVENYRKRLLEAIKGNFPGTEFSEQSGKGIIPCLRDSLSYSVASASNIPGEKSEKFVSQTIEKLLDGIVPDNRRKEYTIILLATPIKDVEERKLHLMDLYSGLAPYAGWQTNFTYTESDSTNSMATFGVNAGVSAGVQSGRNSSFANTDGMTNSTGITETDSTGKTVTDSTGSSITDSTGSSITDSTGSSITNTTGNSSSIANSSTESSSNSHTYGSSSSHSDTEGNSNSVGVKVGCKLVGADYNHGWSKSAADTTGTSISDMSTTGSSTGITKTAADTFSKAVGETVSKAVASSTGKAVASSIGKAIADSTGKAIANSLGRAITKSATTTSGLYKGMNFGGNFGANFARSSNVSASVGKNEGITQSFTNYNIKHTLEILEEQMKRCEQSTALGMWDFAAYVLSEDQNVVSNVAHSYLALTQGEQSYMSRTAVNVWRGDTVNSNDAREICAYLRELRHPIFGLSPVLTEVDSGFIAYPPIVTATTYLSEKELAYSLNFPQKSVEGFPVLECAEFGRNIIGYGIQNHQEMFDLGLIFHMHHEEKNRVELKKNSLCSHMFITGSTGSGKSNTVYKILNEAMDKEIRFMVIEPAKGEYKSIFGMEKDVAVYGTNPYITPLLRLNPFSFPQDIHVFEHIDRLIEIFNVCWPMYAAMPAVLKNAVEKSYEDIGWDLERSINKYGEDLYPTFADVANKIRDIIDNSEYDKENKGAYKGSLLTRLNSLTNGINGLIFVTEEIEAEKLFEENVIIDLSRIGSVETKSLIMGMLVLKLQEYRISQENNMNSELRHITVLEEAHNLLRKTSDTQSAENGNLQGKSVEMISNAIAEMRTYGEGFVIVDQAPGLLDMAVIRNTNTKIIMRLPDQGDRELVGRAANLNDDQIMELAKLPCGVAAVYQNEWVQPVLCKVDSYEKSKKSYTYISNGDIFHDQHTSEISDSLLEYIMNKEIFRSGNKEELQQLKSMVIRSGLDSTVKIDFVKYLASEKKQAMKLLRELMYDFLSVNEAVKAAQSYKYDFTQWLHSIVDAIQPSIKGYTKKQINLALALLLYEQADRDAAYNEALDRFTEVFINEGGVF